jgi:hypothetical protein
MLTYADVNRQAALAYYVILAYTHLTSSTMLAYTHTHTHTHTHTKRLL